MERFKVARRVAEAHPIEQLFSLLKGLIGVLLRPMPDFRNLAAGADELTVDGQTSNDARIVLRVDGCGNDYDEVAEEWEAAHLFQASAASQLIGDADLADRLIAHEEGQAGVIDPGMFLPKEVRRLDDDLDAGNGLAINQQGAEDGLLSLIIMRRQLFGVHASPLRPPARW